MKGRNDERVYSCVLVLSGFFAYLLTFGISWCGGVFYVIFLENLEYSSRPEVALGTALNSALVYAIGPITGALINTFGCRKVGLLGGWLAGAGLILTVLHRNVYYMCAMFGVISGAGLGFSYMSSAVAVSLHFNKYRPIASGITSSAIGVGVFLYPPLMRALTDTYSWRGALLLLGALTLNLMACAALYRRTTHSTSEGNASLKADHLTEQITSITVETRKRPRDWYLFTQLDFVLFCFCNMFICVAMSVIYIHLAAYAGTLHISDDRSALLFSLMGAGTFCGRLLSAGLNQIRGLTGQLLWVIFFSAAGVATLLLPLATTYFHLQVYAATFGLLTGCFGVALIDAIVRMVGLDMFTSAYGYLTLFEGIGQALGGPIAGIIYEMSGMYSASMYFGGGVLVAGALLMAGPAYKRPKDKNIFYVDMLTEKPIL